MTEWTTVTIRRETKSILDQVKQRYKVSFDELIQAAVKLLAVADIHPLIILGMKEEQLSYLFRHDVLSYLRSIDVTALRRGGVVYIIAVPRLEHQSSSHARATDTSASPLIADNPWIGVIRSRYGQQSSQGT